MQGAAVGLLAHRTSADGVLEKVASIGARTAVQPADIGDGDAVRTALHQLGEALGGLDILVHAAAVYPHASLMSMTRADWDEVMRLDLSAALVLMQAAAEHMRPRDGGRIVSISSVAASVPDPELGHYAVAKAGLEALTRQAALEFAPFGITVNAVSPALIDSPELRAHAPERLERFLKRVPLGRVGQPADVAAAVCFLVGPGAGWISGQVLTVDGGLRCAPLY
jgi:3-oxoacyl-[acyl-carrier protein] reductase